jgi:hypothetical protein
MSKHSNFNLLNFQKSLINEDAHLTVNEIPENFSTIKLDNNKIFFRGNYKNLDIEIIFFKNNLLNVKITNVDDVIFDQDKILSNKKNTKPNNAIFSHDFNFIEIEYKNKKMKTFTIDYMTYFLKSTYDWDFFKNKKKVVSSFNSEKIYNKNIYNALNIIGLFDIFEIQKNIHWLLKFNQFLFLFEKVDTVKTLKYFVNDTAIDFTKPNNYIFDLINFNFFSN